VIKLRKLEKYNKNTLKVFKCVAAEGWRISDGPVM
jgi:hypothetical protein